MPGRPRTRRVLAIVLLVLVALVVAALAAEAVLRVVPVPGIAYHTYYYDDVTGQRFYPNTTMIYRNERGDSVRRRVNDWGYLDAPHEQAKAPGVFRIGFFGDSFTEARQVPLAEAFPARIQRELNAASPAHPTECIAIGMMGYGTLQSFLECERWMEPLDLDLVVYVFCENDPGNNVRELNFSDAVPYPLLAGDSLTVDRSFATRYAHKARRPHRTWQFLKSHSLLFSTLETRLRLLRSRGIDVRVDDAERHMEAPKQAGAPIDAQSPPSLWPDSLRADAAAVTERVVGSWRTAVEASGRSFAIAYIPRTAAVRTPAAPPDDWGAWLRATCARDGVALIDPAERLARAQADGRDVFFDHFTSAGHEAFADAIVAWLHDRGPLSDGFSSP